MQSGYLAFRSYLDPLRDKLSPIRHTSTFRKTGEITPEEFLLAGDYLVYKFPSWSWAPAASDAKRVAHLPKEKQYLVTRGVPCSRRLDENFAGDQGDRVVRDGFGSGGSAAEDGEGWLSTGGDAVMEGREAAVGDVRVMGERGEVEEKVEEEEEEIPDIDDDEDEEAIIREDRRGRGPLRTYTLYITYTPYYRTPRLYLSGYRASSNTPLSPNEMLEDIVGDYKDKTVTLEDFPFFDSPVKTASVHPCRHASVMKVLLDRADAALKLRKAKIKAAAVKGKGVPKESGLEGLVDDVGAIRLGERDKGKGKEGPSGGAVEGAGAGAGGDEWEVLGHDNADEEDEPAIRVDQYVVVFLKFMASVTPGIEHDFTMGV